MALTVRTLIPGLSLPDGNFYPFPTTVTLSSPQGRSRQLLERLLSKRWIEIVEETPEAPSTPPPEGVDLQMGEGSPTAEAGPGAFYLDTETGQLYKFC